LYRRCLILPRMANDVKLSKFSFDWVSTHYATV
jgi:hypothetical protein